ncbi:MAG: hypothetical protein HC881_16085 [Leptolyngbyaceae cyanobacterium SL_7_1]|nr:hypothetical protein [Leptolyngbyaceae cyanobacterium SL_7_1]
MTHTTQTTNLSVTYSTTHAQIDPLQPQPQPELPQIDPVLMIVAIALLIKTTLLSTAVLFRVVLLKKL